MKIFILFIVLAINTPNFFAQCMIDYGKITAISNPLIVDDFNVFSKNNAFQWKTTNLLGMNDNCPWYEKDDAHPDNYYKISDDQVSVSNGQLHLKVARIMPWFDGFYYGNCFNYNTWHWARYKTGMLQSGRKFRYGIYEIRCKMPPATPGTWDTWPTLWLYGGDIEIDLFDGGGDNPGSKALMAAINHAKPVPSSTLDHPTWGHLDWRVLPEATSLVGLPAYNQQTLYPVGAIVKFEDKNHTPNERAYQAVRNITTKKQKTVMGNNLNANLSNSFHTYTVAWLPNKVIFFFDGREVFSVDESEVNLTDYTSNPNDTWKNGLNILCNMQLFRGILDANYSDSELNAISMDIDYVKVWELNDANMANSNIDIVRNQFEMMYHEVQPIPHDLDASNYVGSWKERIVESNVDTRYGSIAVNPNNSNEIFFRKKHTDGKFRLFRQDLTTTTPQLIDYNYALNEWAAEAIGEVKYRNGILYYVGRDQRIQFFARLNPTSAPNVWWHGWVDHNWDNAAYWANIRFKVDINGSGVFDVADNGDVYYKSETGELCLFKFTNDYRWYDQPIRITPIGVINGSMVSNYVEGDLSVVTNGVNHKLAYRTLLKSLSGSELLPNMLYVSSRSITSTQPSSYVDFFLSQSKSKVSLKAGSILNRATETYFINLNDNYIHRAASNPASASTPIFQCSSNCAAEKANSGLLWDNNGGIGGIHYVGADRRLQFIYPINPAFDFSLSNTGHWWTESNWNTGYYATYTDQPQRLNPWTLLGSDAFSASYIKNNDKLLYVRKHEQIGGPTVGRLGYLKYEKCDILNPEDESGLNFALKSPTANLVEVNEFNIVNKMTNLNTRRSPLENSFGVKVYPSSTNDKITVEVENLDIAGTIFIFNATGMLIYEAKINETKTNIDISVYPSGMYFVTTTLEGAKYSHKFIKID